MYPIIEYFSKYVKSKFDTPIGKGVYLITRSTAIGQGISIISSPIITRLFSPSEFGVFALYSSIISILLVFASLKYEYAIPLPKDDEDAFYLVVTCFIFILAVFTCMAGIFLFFGTVILDAFKYNTIEPFLWLLLFSFLSAGLYQVFNYWAIREKDYRLIGNTIIGKNALATSSKMLFGWIGTGAFGLIGGDFIGQITGNYSIFRKFWKKNSLKLKNISLEKIFRIAREYYRFPVFSLPSAFFNVLAFQLPIFMLISVYGSNEAGLFSLALNVLALPVSFLSSSISQVYLGEISKLIQEAPLRIKTMYHSVIKHIAIIITPIMILIAVAAPLLFPIIFGSSWEQAGYFCTILSGMLVLQVIFSPVSILHYCGYNNWVFLFDFSRTIIILCIFIISSIFQFTIFLSITLYSISMALMYCVNYFMNIKAISYLEKKYLDYF